MLLKQELKAWGHGLNCGTPAQKVQSPEFKPQ
jgi:hypothetical protein